MKKRTLVLLTTILTLVAVVLTACVTVEPAATTELKGTTWNLLSYGDPQAVLDGTEITLGFGDDTISGTAGCNRYNAGLVITGSELTVGPIATTRMACSEPIMKQEQDFLTALGTADGFQVQDDQLTISYDGGESVLLFSKTTSGAELAGTTWTLLSHGDTSDPQAVLDGTEITLQFAEVSISGSAGCNNYLAAIEFAGSELSVDDKMAVTVKACPDAIMEQERNYLASLASADSYQIENDQLSISYDSGEGVLVFRKADAVADLEGTEWIHVSYGDADQLHSLLEGTEITLNFEGDALRGSAGCNSYNVGYEIAGDNLRVDEAMAMTEMDCGDALMKQERDYATALQAAARYEVQGDMFRIFTVDGQVLVFSAKQIADVTHEITITAPEEDAVLDATRSITVSGTGRGLFEGNVVLQVLDEAGDVLFEQPAVLQGENVGLGGPGTWEFTLELDVEPGTQGSLYAFSPSPVDNSVMASDTVSVTFGE